MLDIHVPVHIDAELLRQAEAVPGAVKAMLEAVAQATALELDVQVERIYAQPIPVDENGTPLWERSGDLKEGRADPFVTENAASIGFDGNSAEPITNWDGGYGERREALGRDWTPANPAGGIIRSNEFIADTVEAMQARIGAIAEQSLQASFEQAGLN